MNDSELVDLPWSRVINLRARDLDYLGHVTEVSHIELIEEARFFFMQIVLSSDFPIYVVASHDLRFRREIRLADGPMTVSIGVDAIGPRYFDLIERIDAADGTPRTLSRARLVAFDLTTRHSRDLTAAEASGAEPFLIVKP